MRLQLHFFGSVALIAVAAGLQLGAIMQENDKDRRAAARAFIERHHCVEVGEPRGVWGRGAWRCDKDLPDIKEMP